MSIVELYTFNCISLSRLFLWKFRVTHAWTQSWIVQRKNRYCFHFINPFLFAQHMNAAFGFHTFFAHFSEFYPILQLHQIWWKGYQLTWIKIVSGLEEDATIYYKTEQSFWLYCTSVLLRYNLVKFVFSLLDPLLLLFLSLMNGVCRRVFGFSFSWTLTCQFIIFPIHSNFPIFFRETIMRIHVLHTLSYFFPILSFVSFKNRNSPTLHQ